MGYSPDYRKSARKYLDTQSPSTRSRIMDAVDKLPDGDVIKLQGREGYRLTVGGYRVLFRYTGETNEEGNEVIDVMYIGPRGDVYKRLK